PAPYGGVLSAILNPEGRTAPVGTPIAVMETPEMAAERRAAGMPSTGTGVDIPQDRSRSPEAERLRLSPVVRKLADEHGLPLEEVARLPGSGAGGRVTKEDVSAAARSEEHTSELQSRVDLICRLLLE